MEVREGSSDTASTRCDSLSPHKGEYNVQKDRLSPPLSKDEASPSDSSGSSEADSDVSDSEGISGKQGSYDVLAASHTAAAAVVAVEMGDHNGRERVNIDETEDGTPQQCDTTDGSGSDDQKKTFDEGTTDNEDSDKDEFFDAVDDINVTVETTEHSGLVLPDSSVVGDVDSSDLDGEPPPPPSTAQPVLQSIRPDILTKYSLSQGWIERVNRSLEESSRSRDDIHRETSSEPEIGMEGNNESSDFSAPSDGVASNRKKSHALLDQLKKSASDNRHDYIPRHVISKRSAKKNTVDPASDNNSQQLHGEATPSDQEMSGLASLFRNGPTSKLDDTAPPATTKLRRTAYVRPSKYRSRFLGSHDGTGYCLPIVARHRTDSYMRAVSHDERPCSGQEVDDIRKDGGIAINFTKMKTSGSVLPVRSCAEGVLIPTWTSLPVFSTTDHADHANLLSAGQYGRETYDSVATATTGIGTSSLSANKDLIPNSDSYHHALNTNHGQHTQTMNHQEESSLPRESSKTNVKKKRNDKHSSHVMDVAESDGTSSRNDKLDSNCVESTDSRVKSTVRFTDPIAIENDSSAPQDIRSDDERNKKKARSDYELSLDAENDVMRVNISEPHGLKRKPAVRRKTATFQSKTLPRNTGSSINKRRRPKEDSRPQSKGSSLDLAPSLLNLYDGIIASASKGHDSLNRKDTETVGDAGQDAVEEDLNDEIFTDNKVSSQQTRATPGASSSPNGHHQYTASGTHKRTGSGGKQQLPSLSVPPDRPVSMAEAEVLASSSGERGSGTTSNKETKQKRPLSLSAGTVPSLHPSAPSLSALRQRQLHPKGGRTINNIDEDMIPENGNEEISQVGPSTRNRCRGLCTRAQAERSMSKEMQRKMPSSVTLTSESRNSVDSGCILHIDSNSNSIKGKDLKSSTDQCSTVRDNLNETEESLEANKTFCSCYLYDNMSVSSSDTTGSGSFSYRDEVDSSTSSIRDGSVPRLAQMSSSASSSSSSLHPANDKTSSQDFRSKENRTSRRSITGLPNSVSEGFLSSSPSSSTRRYNVTQHLSPSGLPLGHHYPNYQPLDERLATSPDTTSKYLGFFTAANDSGLATDHHSSLTSTPGSRLSGPVPSPWSNSSSIASCTDDSNFTGSESPELLSPRTGKTSSVGARRSSSFSKTEARKRFFSNYEEHMRQLERQQKGQEEQSSNSAVTQTDSLVTSLDPSPDQNCLVSQSQRRDDPETDDASIQASNNHETHNQDHKHDASHEPRSNTHTHSLPGKSPQPHTLSSSTISSCKPHSPPISPGLSSSSAGHRTSSSGQSSKSGKKRESSSTSSDVKPAGSGYVSYVQRVVAEILESERTYIASLKDIIQGYLEPMEQILRSTDAKEDLAGLFGNIRDIFKFGCGFLADLELTSLDPVKVAECFVKHNKGFVIYTDYCTNYPRAVEILTRFMQHPELSELCKERQLALGHGLPLGAYLLRPVQRILKYHLLLQNIVKNCEKEAGGSSRSERGSTSSTVSTSSNSPTSPGASVILEQAFQHMTHMASHINEMKRKHEHAVRIQEIQSQLEDYVGEDLTRLGELVLESTFRVYGAKASRQVFLFERGLLISKKKEGGMLSCKTFIRCSNLMLVEVIPNEPLSFHTIPFDNPRAQYTLQARNMEQKRRWCQEIKRLILESYKEKIPDNVKSLVMQLGRNHDDDYVTKEALEAVRKNQHTAPEYLEKRRFRRKSGPRLPDFSLLKPQRAKKGGNNKKGDNKGVEINKLSPGVSRRAESKSPDSQRKFLIKQVAKKRSQSQTASLPTTPLSDMAYLELFDRSNLGKKGNGDSFNSDSEDPVTKLEDVKGDTEEKQNQHKHISEGVAHGNTLSSLSSMSSLVAVAVAASSSDPPNLPPSSPHSQAKTGTKLGEPQEDVGGTETESLEDKDTMESLVTKRASSFRKAMRAHPITSADISELVVRCGGAGSLHLSPRKGSATKPNSTPTDNQEKSHSGSVDKEMNRNKSHILESPSAPVSKETSKCNLVTSDVDESDNEEEELPRISPFQLSNEDLENQISEVSRAISNGSFLSYNNTESDELSRSFTLTEGDTSAQEKSLSLRSASLPLLNDSDEEEGGSHTGSTKCKDHKYPSQSNDDGNSSRNQKTSPSRKCQQQQCSHSVEDICGEHKGNWRNNLSGQGRMSRRDLQDRAAQLKMNSVGSKETSIKHSTQANNLDNYQTKPAEEVVLSSELESNRILESNLKTDDDPLSDKAVLLRNKVKGLRLPNTHKHLSVQDYTSNSALRNNSKTEASKARLIGWSSVDKLTRGSMTDLSHLSEDPWVRNTEAVSSEDSKKSNTLTPEHQRYSATLSSSSSGEGSKENLDWLVYLNRNSRSGSLSSIKPLSALPSQFSNPKSSELVDKHISTSLTDGINISDSSQYRGINTSREWKEMSYATPPRAFMNLENMHKFENSTEEKSSGSRRNLTQSSPSVSTANPRPARITLAKPVKLEEASNLSRSNSLPITSCHGHVMSYSAVKSVSRNRHSSIQNVDHLSEQESAQRMIAEMEEYIKAVTAPSGDSATHRCLPQRFPTSLPAITVEEEGNEGCDDDDDHDDDDTRPPGSNRLSIISSVSTSSYESQGSCGSSTSDGAVEGLVGTLKQKLHAWAKDSYPDEEQQKENNSSSDSSTINQCSVLESDDECGEDETHLVSSNETRSVRDEHNINGTRNTFKREPGPKNKTVKEERQLENVLREHSLGSSSLGLRMAKASSLLESTPARETLPMSPKTLQTNTKKPISTSSAFTEQVALPEEQGKVIDSNVKKEKPRYDRTSSSVCDVNSPTNKDIVSLNKGVSALSFPADPYATRFSLPPSKEATEALMPAALRGDGCEIQQSDSGFSLQSTTSSSNDGSGSNEDISKSLDASPLTEKSKTEVSDFFSESGHCHPPDTGLTKAGKTLSEGEFSSHGSEMEKQNQPLNSELAKAMKTSDFGMKRSESCGSMDSTDSFYERRLSVAFESDDFCSLPSVVKARQDFQLDERSVASGDSSPRTRRYSAMSSPAKTITASSQQTFPLVHTDIETPLSRKSIREYVQSIEEMFRPQSPKVMEVRRREPGAMIRERLQNLRDQAVYGRIDSSDERGHSYTRSKSQPPSQHRSGLLPSSSHSSLSSLTSGCNAEGTSRGAHQPHSTDDIFLNDCKVSGSRDSLGSLSNGPQPVTMWGSRESVFFPSVLSSRSKDKLNSLSKERLYSSRECLLKDKRTSSIDLMRTGSTEPVTRESILASPVLARKNKGVTKHLGNQHQHQDSLLSPPMTPNVFCGDSSKSGHDITARFSMPSSTTGSVSHWNRKNQFVHRARSSSDRSSVSLSERSCSPVLINSDAGTRGVKTSSSFCPSSPLLDSHSQSHLSRSTGRLDQMSTEVDNLVIMKGWVRSLISKFQDQT